MPKGRTCCLRRAEFNNLMLAFCRKGKVFNEIAYSLVSQLLLSTIGVLLILLLFEE